MGMHVVGWVHFVYHCYALPSQVGIVGGDYEGGVDPSSMPFERGICLIWGIVTVHSLIYMCIVLKEIVPVEGN